jgi:DNA-binding response OmpR family regulator
MRLLVVEDSPRLQELLEAGFRRAGFAVDVVGDGPRALAFARRGHYDVVVLDLMLPGLDGLEVLRALRSGGHDVNVLVLTARHTVEERVKGLQLGADDYLQKPFSFDELLARVHALVRRKYGSKGAAVVVGYLVVDTVKRRVTWRELDVPLTRRELQILEYLSRRRGATVTRAEIEDHVYGERNLPESNAIESAISCIRRKLRVLGAPAEELLQTRHGVGYCLDERGAP